MKLSSEAEPAPLGLRERKKVKTRAAIRRHAMRLFREQGYNETTVEQIAEAAEVSPSTFFRYFPTKEDVVVQDDLDILLVEAFEAQPPELSALSAMREALHMAYINLSPEEVEEQKQSLILARTIPEVRATMLDEFSRGVQLITNALAKRTGRMADDIVVRTFAGAVIGVAISLMMVDSDDPMSNFGLMEEGLKVLEAGISL